MTSTPGFGDVVDSSKAATEEQLAKRQYGFSSVCYEGSPTVYKTGDVVNLPYEPDEYSSMEAVGLAWAAYAEGIPPED